ncbi:MAG: DNA repair protein rad50 [Piccolia ochrophora]|nr:MAG: DNA repair protein rad50 [Piccolia ochrophora]
MVATRSLQLTVKKTTRSQKTLEGQLLMIKDGERTAISSRVAELDQIMPQYLGVSKAVLDSVIFCHQDESLWPMSEPAVLKKKFDEIFEALKYTKAIDNIKVLRKKQNEELGKYNLLEEQFKIDKQRADRVCLPHVQALDAIMLMPWQAEKQSRELNTEIENLREETTRLKTEIERVTKEADNLWSQASEFENVIATLRAKREKARDKKETVDELSNHIEHLDQSDESIIADLETYEARMANLDKEIAAQATQLYEMRASLDQTRRGLQDKLTEQGKYEAEKSLYEQQLKRRENLTRDSARQHNIRGFDTQLGDDLIREFMAKLAKISRDHHLKLERTKRETQEELQETQGVLNQLGERRSALSQTKEHARQEISYNDEKASAHQADLDDLDVDEGMQASLQSTVSGTESTLDRAKQDLEAANWDRKIEDANAQLRDSDEKGENLNKDLIQSTKQANDLARFEFLEKELEHRQTSLETMSGAHGDKIAREIGQEWRPSTLERDFHSAMDKKRKELSDAQLQRDALARELEQLDFKLTASKDTLKEQRQKIKRCERLIREVIPDEKEPAEYPDVVAELERDRDVAKGDVGNFAHSQSYFQEGIRIANHNSRCRLCHRSFNSKKEVSEFIARLQSLVAERDPATSAKELAEIEEDLRIARAAGSSYEIYRRLSDTEVPALEVGVRTLDSQRDALLKEVERHDEAVNLREQVLREVESLTKTILQISKYSADVTSLEGQIKELSSRPNSAGLTKSLDQIQADLATQREQSRGVKNTISSLMTQKEQARARINDLELELRDVQTKVKDVSHLLEKKRALRVRVEEFRGANIKQRESVRQAENEIEKLAPQLAKAQAKLDDIQTRGADKEGILQEEASRLSESLNQLRTVDQDINMYLDRGGPNQLSRSRREVEQTQQELAQLDNEQKQIAIAIDKAQRQQDKQKETKRTLSDNLRYRRDVNALDSLSIEITQLEDRNAEIDRDRFVAEANRMSARHRKLSAEEASKMGAMKSKDDQLMKLLADWETDYKDAARNFKEAHIKATKAAIEDLGRYGGALDKAIMKYHSLKMEEINGIVEELWKKTYQGTDVDTVLIRSDYENAKGNRSYNYRVCMVKQDAEMDMRGRCSAGQKVLASIIIRLALAECFGTNCGLIALDEPTTNLDRDNIRSLAESLHDIIRQRQKQSNFQLIVITHDEDFLRHMQCADFCDNYYRVTRNNRQKSIIERQSIAEVV